MEEGLGTVAAQALHGRMAPLPRSLGGPSHGCQWARPATGDRRGLNTNLSLSTVTASGCYCLASSASHPPWSSRGNGSHSRGVAAKQPGNGT